MAVSHGEFLREAGPGFSSTYGAFMADLTSELLLSDEEGTAAASLHPSLWTPVLVSSLSGEVEISLPAGKVADDIIPPAAQALVAGIVEYDGVEYVNLGRGRLARLFRELYEVTDAASKARSEKVSEASARYLFALGVAADFKRRDWASFMPAEPQTTVRFDKPGLPRITFASCAEEYPIEGPVRSVVTYGPGLTVAQLAKAMRGRVDELYLVSGGLGGHFVTSLAKRRLQRQAREAARSADPDGNRVPETHYYKRGITASLGRIATQVARRGKVDVVLMSAVHSAGPEECVAGVEGAQRFLRRGGLFVVKAPDVSLTGEAGLDVVGPAAESFFGSPVAAGACGDNAQFIDPTLPRRRPASYAIYEKR